MHRRSFNPRFRQPILDGIKTTTIRDKPWPIDTPIMAFEWTGKPYRSKQKDIAPVTVNSAISITITRNEDGSMDFPIIMGLGRHLWECEGFNTQADMDTWFQSKMKPGQSITKVLHRFRLAP